jgi:hypothetical protein
VVETVENPFDITKNEFLVIDKTTSVGGKNAVVRMQERKEKGKKN